MSTVDRDPFILDRPTGRSLRARDVLDHWSQARGRFVKVFPNEYRRALAEMGAKRETTDTIAKARSDKSAADKKSRAKA